MPVLPQNLITQDRAFLHAVTFLEFTKASVQQVPIGFENIPVFQVVDNPSLVYDVAESPLFYEFPINDGENGVGAVRIAAIKSLGHPWMSIGIKPPLDAKATSKAVKTLLGILYPGSELISVRLTAFNFPRIGFVVRFRKSDGSAQSRLFDPEFPELALQEVPEGTSIPDHEGNAYWSLLSSLPEGSIGDDSPIFSDADELVSKMVAHDGARKANVWDKSTCVELIKAAILDQPEGQQVEEGLIEPTPGVIRQEKSDYCVIASIDMLLRFFEIETPANQSEIRSILVQEPVIYSPGGVFPSRQIEAFERCFPEDFSISKDLSPTWTEAKEAIDDNLPFKSGIFGHSRVCIGYREVSITSGGDDAITERQRYLYVNDPNRDETKLELYERKKGDEDWRPVIPVKTNYFYARPNA